MGKLSWFETVRKSKLDALLPRDEQVSRVDGLVRVQPAALGRARLPLLRLSVRLGRLLLLRVRQGRARDLGRFAHRTLVRSGVRENGVVVHLDSEGGEGRRKDNGGSSWCRSWQEEGNSVPAAVFSACWQYTK